MDWIHCNGCYIQPGEITQRKFSLTSCGHIYCNECLISVSAQQKCGVCSNKFTTILLTSKMKPDVYEFFKPPDEVLTKLVQVLAFQNGHRIRMTAHHKIVVQKYKAAKEEIKRLHDIIRSFQKKITILENHMEELKKGNSSSPVQSPKVNNTQSNTSMRNSPGQRILMTPNRLTLRHASPNNKSSPTSPLGFNISISSPVQSSFNKTSTPLNQSSHRLNLNNTSPQLLPSNTYISPVPVHVPSRTLKQFSSQPPTPASPRVSTPVKSPSLPESAHHIYGSNSQVYRSQRQEMQRGAVNTDKRTEYPQNASAVPSYSQKMSPVHTYSLIRKNYSMH